MTHAVPAGLRIEANGMSTVAFRLGERMRRRAMTTGGVAYPAGGDDWVAVIHERPDADWPVVDVRFWARHAYVHARSLQPRGGGART